MNEFNDSKIEIFNHFVKTTVLGITWIRSLKAEDLKPQKEETKDFLQVLAVCSRSSPYHQEALSQGGPK